MNTRVAFVTGGSGFIGRPLIAGLVRDGWAVRALARSDDAANVVTGLGAEAVPGDVNTPEALDRGATGADVVFHLAATIDVHGSTDAFRSVNVEGTRAVVRSARRSGIPKVVFVGAGSVVMTGDDQLDVTEVLPRQRPRRCAYTATKSEAEEVLEKEAGDAIVTVTIRPAMVWGEGDRTLLPGVVAAARARRWAWIGGGRFRYSTTHVDNVVHACLLAVNHTRSDVFYVADDEQRTMREFLIPLAATTGVELRGPTVPRLVARTVAGGFALAAKLSPSLQAPLTPSMVFLLGHEFVVVDTHARRELGYQPIITIAEGLQRLANQRTSK